MIQKAKFDLQNFLPYLLSQAADASSCGFRQYYKDNYGMLRTEWQVVFHLGCYGKMTAKEICDRGGIHKTKVSRAVAALGKKRFLTSAEFPDDRRHEELTLTRAGLVAYSDLSREAAQFDFQLVSTISDADQQVLRRCLRQIARL